MPYWAQDGVHEIFRDWHGVLAEYDGDRALCAEAWLPTPEQTALWVRPDEMHQAFNFPYLLTGWDAAALRTVIDESLQAFGAVGAPSTWVLSNHDVVRHASRLALTAESPQGHGIGPKSPGKPIADVGLRRARAATTVMLALPGSAYLYQGEELGLPEVDRTRRRCAPGPDVVPHRRRALRSRRLPRADPVERRCSRLRVQPRRRVMAAPARRMGRPRALGAGEGPGIHPVALPNAPRRPPRTRSRRRDRRVDRWASARTSSHSGTGM